jgi:hypothetical protein
LSGERRIVNWLTREIAADGIREAIVVAPLFAVDPAVTEVALLRAEAEELIRELLEVVILDERRTSGSEIDRFDESP